MGENFDEMMGEAMEEEAGGEGKTPGGDIDNDL
jgi:hypothetical protein